MKWLDGVLADPELASAVEERLAEMKIEQELVALREREGLSQRVRNLGLKTLAKYAAATGTRLNVSFEPIQHHRKPARRHQAASVHARRSARRSTRTG